MAFWAFIWQAICFWIFRWIQIVCSESAKCIGGCCNHLFWSEKSSLFWFLLWKFPEELNQARFSKFALQSLQSLKRPAGSIQSRILNLKISSRPTVFYHQFSLSAIFHQLDSIPILSCSRLFGATDASKIWTLDWTPSIRKVSILSIQLFLQN